MPPAEVGGTEISSTAVTQVTVPGDWHEDAQRGGTRSDDLPLPPGSLWAAGVLAAMSLVVLFQARPRDTPVILLAALVALSATTIASHWVAAPGPAFVGALAVGLLGNATARISGRPAQVAVLPGILLLVPGSVGFEAVSAMLQDEVLVAVQTAFAALMAAVALAAGLLVANAAFPARKSL